MPDPQITPGAYEPDADLRELLDEPMTEATVEYGDERDLDLPGSANGYQQATTITFGEFELSGFETYSSLGFFTSLEGHLGLAAAVVLEHALRLGVPTQCYLDEGPPESLHVDPYQDLTAEWYPEHAVAMGLPESRLENRVVGFKAETIALSELERYVRVWLSAGE